MNHDPQNDPLEALGCAIWSDESVADVPPLDHESLARVRARRERLLTSGDVIPLRRRRWPLVAGLSGIAAAAAALALVFLSPGRAVFADNYERKFRGGLDTTRGQVAATERAEQPRASGAPAVRPFYPDTQLEIAVAPDRELESAIVGRIVAVLGDHAQYTARPLDPVEDHPGSFGVVSTPRELGLADPGRWHLYVVLGLDSSFPADPREVLEDTDALRVLEPEVIDVVLPR